ncbi:MAG: hypothetical protein R2939_19970 [Kofleriaceae bacterium]
MATSAAENLLLNKQYQLQFTLFMVAVTALLITGLSVWVMQVADKTTAVGVTRVRGEPCPDIPSLANAISPPAAAATPPADAPAADAPAADAPAAADPASDAAAAMPAPPAADVPPPAADDADSADAADADAADADAAAADDADAEDGDDEPRRRPRVVIDEGSMTITAIAPPNFVSTVVAHWQCELRHAGAIADLERGRTHILLALIISGVVLTLGLAIYGIKMTHKVAGPLFKVSLYLAKMKNGRLDKVWNLRKGDQLIEFYEHIKRAHAGLVSMQQADIAQLRAVLDAAREGKWAERSPEVAAQLDAVAALLAQKEKSLE